MDSIFHELFNECTYDSRLHLKIKSWVGLQLKGWRKKFHFNAKKYVHLKINLLISAFFFKLLVQKTILIDYDFIPDFRGTLYILYTINESSRLNWNLLPTYFVIWTWDKIGRASFLSKLGLIFFDILVRTILLNGHVLFYGVGSWLEILIA